MNLLGNSTSKNRAKFPKMNHPSSSSSYFVPCFSMEFHSSQGTEILKKVPAKVCHGTHFILISVIYNESLKGQEPEDKQSQNCSFSFEMGLVPPVTPSSTRSYQLKLKYWNWRTGSKRRSRKFIYLRETKRGPKSWWMASASNTKKKLLAKTIIKQIKDLQMHSLLTLKYSRYRTPKMMKTRWARKKS